MVDSLLAKVQVLVPILFYFDYLAVHLQRYLSHLWSQMWVYFFCLCSTPYRYLLYSLWTQKRVASSRWLRNLLVVLSQGRGGLNLIGRKSTTSVLVVSAPHPVRVLPLAEYAVFFNLFIIYYLKANLTFTCFFTEIMFSNTTLKDALTRTDFFNFFYVLHLLPAFLTSVWNNLHESCNIWRSYIRPFQLCFYEFRRQMRL